LTMFSETAVENMNRPHVCMFCPCPDPLSLAFLLETEKAEISSSLSPIYASGISKEGSGVYGDEMGS